LLLALPAPPMAWLPVNVLPLTVVETVPLRLCLKHPRS